MATTTKQQINALFEQLVARGGEEYRQHLQLHEGSRTYGRPWRLYFVNPHNGGVSGFPGLDDGYLGWSKAEVYQTLRGLLAGMDAAKLMWGLRFRTAAASAPIKNGVSTVLSRYSMVIDEMAPPTEF